MAEDQTPDQDSVALPLVLAGEEDVPLLFANHFVVQFWKGDWFMVVGQVNPPLMLGTPEEQREQAKKLQGVPVRILGRYGFPFGRLQELHELIGRQIEAYREYVEKGVDDADD